MKKILKNLKWYIKSFIHIFYEHGYCHKIEQKIMAQYYSEQYSIDGGGIKTKNSTVIIMVDGRYLQGGLADRLRGITSVYDYCKKHNVSFKIKFTSPFLLNNYLQPNKYDWTINEKDICYNTNCAVVRLLNDYEIPTTLHSLYLKHWLKQGKQIHIYTNSNFRDEYFGRNFHELFKPSAKLQEQIGYHLAQIGGKYISISFRFTTLLGDFQDCINHPLEKEEQDNLINKCLTAISNIDKIGPAHSKILVTADSEKFLKEATKLPNTYIIAGSVGHFDYSSNEEKEMKTFLDFLMIAGAEAVYLARSGQMYNSGFCRHAAMISGKKFTLYNF